MAINFAAASTAGLNNPGTEIITLVKDGGGNFINPPSYDKMRTYLRSGEVPMLFVTAEGGETGSLYQLDEYSETENKIRFSNSANTIEFCAGAVAPVVSDVGGGVKPVFKPEGKSYLTFRSPNEFTLSLRYGSVGWNGTLEYFDSDETWTTWSGRNVLSAVANGGEYVLYLRGIGNSGIGGKEHEWNLDGTDIKCIGNIENLLDYATVESGNHPIMRNSCYKNMFSNCTSLTQAPALPATTLADNCYGGMFSGCTGLTQAPELPATTLTSYCYISMFAGCTSLIKAPALPATTLANSCYMYMFGDCTSLTQAPALPATTLADGCYYGMFSGCTGLKLSSARTDEYTQEYRIPSSGNGVTANDALGNMFTGTGGTFTGTPETNTTYYLSSDNMVIRETDIATLNGYVNSVVDTAIENHEYIIPSSTEGSTKKFKITVDDNGNISATEVT